MTIDEQLKHPANFLSDTGKLMLVKCQLCHIENYGLAVAGSYCAWCGWNKPKEGKYKRVDDTVVFNAPLIFTEKE